MSGSDHLAFNRGRKTVSDRWRDGLNEEPASFMCFMPIVVMSTLLSAGNQHMDYNLEISQTFRNIQLYSDGVAWPGMSARIVKRELFGQGTYTGPIGLPWYGSGNRTYYCTPVRWSIIGRVHPRTDVNGKPLTR
jgi:hypothetical protein